MVRSWGKDLVSRTPLVVLRDRARLHGTTIPTTDRRDVVGAKTFMAIKNIVLSGNVPFTNGEGKMYHRDSIKVLQQHIYERVSGTGAAGILCHRLRWVKNRDALVTMCLILDAEQIPLLDHSKSAMDTKLANAHDRARILANLELIANHGHPVGAVSGMPSFPCILPKLPTSAKSFDQTLFQKLIPVEIRYMVYNLLIEGRVVKVHLYKGTVKTTCPNPTLMYFSRESRAYALERYSLINDFQYFHLKLDTLALSLRLALFNKESDRRAQHGMIKAVCNALPYDTKERVEKLALSRNSFALNDSPPHRIGAISEFVSLKSLSWIRPERTSFQPHYVHFKPATDVEMGLVVKTEVELRAEFHKAQTYQIDEGHFVIDEVQEERFED